MIRSFADADTEKVWQRVYVRRFSAEMQHIAYRRLLTLDHATTLRDLSAVPGHRLEKLVGDRAGQYSIRINQQWRVCFHWSQNYAENVEITKHYE